MRTLDAAAAPILLALLSGATLGAAAPAHAAQGCVGFRMPVLPEDGQAPMAAPSSRTPASRAVVPPAGSPKGGAASLMGGYPASDASRVHAPDAISWDLVAQGQLVTGTVSFGLAAGVGAGDGPETITFLAKFPQGLRVLGASAESAGASLDMERTDGRGADADAGTKGLASPHRLGPGALRSPPAGPAGAVRAGASGAGAARAGAVGPGASGAGAVAPMGAPAASSRGAGQAPAARRQAADEPLAWRLTRPPGTDVLVTLEIEAEAPLSAGAFRLHLPGLNAGAPCPRFEGVDQSFRLAILAESTVSVDHNGSAATMSVTEGASGAVLTRAESLAAGKAGLPAIDLAWSLEGGDETSGQAWARERRDGRREVSMVLTAPAIVEQGRARVKDVTFVLDASGSMAQAGKLDVARQSLLAALGSLREDDAAQVVSFASEVRASGPVPLAGEPGRQEAAAFLKGVRADGGTLLAPALAQAFHAQRTGSGQRLVVVLTDGRLSDEERVLDMLATTATDVRLLLVSIGADASLETLRRLAEAGRGEALQVGSPESLAAAMESLLKSFASPVAWDLTVDWDGVRVAEVLPARVPDLHAGRPVALRGVLEEGARLPSRLRVRGTTIDGEDTFDVIVPVVEFASVP